MIRRVQQSLLLLCIATLAALSLSACDSTLEENPKTFRNPDNYFKNATEVRAAASGIYKPFFTYGGYKFSMWADATCDSDVVYCDDFFGGGMTGNDYASKFWTKGSNSSWSTFYSVIAQANTLLQGVSASDSPVDQEILDAAKGQAYFLRGFAYFSLGLRYGDAVVRDKLFNPSQGGFGDAARQPVHEVWLQAVRDLKKAAELLPPDYAGGYQRGRPTGAAAKGMLAKLYLHMAGKEFVDNQSEELWYDEYLANNRKAYVDSARMAAAEVVDQGESNSFPSLEDNYMDLFDEDIQGGSNEILFAIQLDKHSDGSGAQGSEMPHYYNPKGVALDGTSFHGGSNLGSVNFRYQWVQEQDSTDKRFAVGTALHGSWRRFETDTTYVKETIPENPSEFSYANGDCSVDFSSNADVQETFNGVVWYTAGDAFCNIVYPDGGESFIRISPRYYTRKYISPGASSKIENGSDVIILRYADVILIYAEALARSGRQNKAVEQLNKVRARAGAPTFSGAGDIDEKYYDDRGNAGVVTKTIWAERLRELYGELDRRWDLLRQGLFFEKMDAVGKTRPPSRRLLPLPAVEINGNAKIDVNNPGY